MKLSVFRPFAFVIASVVVSGSVALAHHGVTGGYDTSKPIVLSGTITQTTFTPPHPVVVLRVEAGEVPTAKIERPDEFTGPFVLRPEDVGKVREIEFSPVRTFYSLGERLKVGDRVMVIALRNCLPPYQLRSSWIKLSDGQVISYAGGLHKKVDGC